MFLVTCQNLVLGIRDSPKIICEVNELMTKSRLIRGSKLGLSTAIMIAFIVVVTLLFVLLFLVLPLPFFNLFYSVITFVFSALKGLSLWGKRTLAY